MIRTIIRRSQGKFTDRERRTLGEKVFVSEKIKEKEVTEYDRLFVQNIILKREKKELYQANVMLRNSI